ncbi:MAG: 30S ribosomal protein S7 [Gammaproteobacteria bacterium]|jgi:small subunit ribosomal protein S7|nr:30S ribosomal protein S7 [Gammaproteobacteria bacterium]MBT4462814.1 30S ribosomal protein S7 [Gammaproteobacteria bacterium]MBT4655083.1 30S ribosomal protein S7 [Gammaproteobacteria bacterium]MBT7323457.1 30S ribosomal protein S7 [Gammaproteobacteria bacterium]MBT7932635.1 30S ribosomal protein S7 [Gammaproteobacteria bacterium]
MPRKKTIFKKHLKPDPIFNSTVVSRFTNMIMSDGKKRTAEKIIYAALEIMGEKNKADPLSMMEKALQNVSPSVEVKSRRVGGSNYQVPVEVNPRRKLSLAMRWILDAALKRNDKAMKNKLASELLDACEGKGSAVKKREDVHKMAEANKAFAHYRW